MLGIKRIPIAVMDDEAPAWFGFDVIVQLDVVARQRGLQGRKLRAELHGNALLNFPLDFLTSSAFDGGSGGIFASGYESSAGLRFNAVNKLAKNVFEFHGIEGIVPLSTFGRQLSLMPANRSVSEGMGPGLTDAARWNISRRPTWRTFPSNKGKSGD